MVHLCSIDLDRYAVHLKLQLIAGPPDHMMTGAIDDPTYWIVVIVAIYIINLCATQTQLCAYSVK